MPLASGSSGARPRTSHTASESCPAPKRRALSAVYAFARRIDDIGDGDLSPEKKLAGLAETRRQAEHPERFPATTRCWWRSPTPRAATRSRSTRSASSSTAANSTRRARSYQTWDELAVYCRDVAGSIGRLSLGVFNPPALHSDPKPTEELADKLGLALQLTNILRDVREDLQDGRVYLPPADPRRVRLHAAPAARTAPSTRRTARWPRSSGIEARRAETLYAEGLELLPLLDRRSRGCCAALSGIYHELLGRIAADPQATFGARLSLPASTKLAVAARRWPRGCPGRAAAARENAAPTARSRTAGR